ncbi:MAG: hypothetical protein SWK90_07840 [Chloroflexota bacterium]|nr:hypothetical protein [Chloroflexota bacterium]
MEETYLIIDLRNNKYAAALLTISELKWYAESIFQVVKDWDTGARDSASVVPLSFCGRPKDRNWSPIQPEVIQAFDESEFEVIHSLFDEPRDRLERLLPATLGPLLRRTFEQYDNVSHRLMLMDNANACDVLESRFEGFIKQKNIRVSIPGDWGALGGFALAFREVGAEQTPNEGAEWLCEFRDSTTRRYTWNDGRFTFESADTARSAPGDPISRWRSAEELERAGAVLLVLCWQDLLTEGVSRRIDVLRRQLEKDRHLLDRLRGAYERLSADSFVLRRQTA